MGNIIKVSASEMKKDASNLENDTKHLEKEIIRLTELMQALSNCWEGEAWNAYEQQTKENLKQLVNVCNMELEFVKTFKQSIYTYQRMEQRVREDVDSIPF